MDSINNDVVIRVNYPYAIMRAVALAVEMEELSTLTAPQLRVLGRLIKMIDLVDPEAQIFADRKALAGAANTSPETVQRTLGVLERFGFLERNQRTSRSIRGSESPIRFHSQFLLQLGLLGHTQPKSCAKENVQLADSARRTYPQKNARPTVNPASSKGESFSQLTTSNHPKAGSLHRSRLPADLQFLVVEKRLRESSVFKLMGKASAAGQRLSDIVFLTKKRIDSLSQKDIYGYLMHLILCDKDWSYQRRCHDDEVEMQEFFLKRDFELVQRSQQFVGKAFRSPDGQAILRVMANGFLNVEAVRGGKCVRMARKLSAEDLRLLESDVLVVVASEQARSVSQNDSQSAGGRPAQQPVQA